MRGQKEETLDPENAEKVKAHAEEYFKGMFSNVRSKNWDALIEQVKQSGIEGVKDDAMVTLALIQAVAKGAPIDVLLKLIDEGAQLSHGVLVGAVIRRDIKIIDALVGRGLNLHLRDPEGRTALYYSLTDLRKREVFDYLISQG